MTGSNLAAVILPFALGSAMVIIALTGSHLPAPVRRDVQRWLMPMLFIVGLTAIAFSAVVGRYYEAGFTVLLYGIALFRFLTAKDVHAPLNGIDNEG